MVNKLLNNFDSHCSNCERLYPNLFDLSFNHIVQSFLKKTVDLSKTKMLFELQKTFDIERRLATWVRNDKTFAPKQQIKQDRL